MNRERLASWLDAFALGLVLVVALALRSDLDYRTAFVDEAVNLYNGWLMLSGREAPGITFHMGWPVLSYGPLGLAGMLGGVEGARGLNAVLGTLTVLPVALAARKVYGRLAGHIAGAAYAVYGPAIAVGTLATYDALSLLLAGTGLYLWLVALLDRRSRLYPAGSALMALAVLTKYAAAALVVVAAAVLAIAAVAQQAEPSRRPTILHQGTLTHLLLIGAPLLTVPLYALIYRQALLQVWQGQVLSKQVPELGIEQKVLGDLAYYLGPMLPVAMLAFLERGRRGLSLGLLAIGASLGLYQLLNRDVTTLYKHTCYMALALAPMAGGGVVALPRRLLFWRGAGAWRMPVAGVLGLALAGLLAMRGQGMLDGLRTFWPDTTQLIVYLRRMVQEDSTLLMEQGQIGRFYLIENGVPGHTPQEIHETWYYQDELGAGREAYKRGVIEKRFDWIIFDYTQTGDLDRELLPLMEGRYAQVAAFPARIHGSKGQIDVFKAIR